MKSVFTILVLFLTISISAQGKAEKSAKKAADNMTEVVGLKETQSKQVYEIQFNKFTKGLVIKEANADDKETIKAELKVLNKGAQKEIEAVIGVEKMKQWKQYLKENKKKK